MRPNAAASCCSRWPMARRSSTSSGRPSSTTSMSKPSRLSPSRSSASSSKPTQSTATREGDGPTEPRPHRRGSPLTGFDEPIHRQRVASPNAQMERPPATSTAIHDAASGISKEAMRVGHRNAKRAIWRAASSLKMQQVTIKNELVPIGSAHVSGLGVGQTLPGGSHKKPRLLTGPGVSLFATAGRSSGAKWVAIFALRD